MCCQVYYENVVADRERCCDEADAELEEAKRQLADTQTQSMGNDYFCDSIENAISF